MAPGTKVSLFGCGTWGKNIARNLSELGALHSIVDPSEFAKDLAAKLDVAYFETADEVLADPGVAAVAVATPAATHFEMASRAINAGKDVFVEKPISLNVADGRILGELAQAKGRILMVGHLLNYHPVFLKLKEIVAAGELGRIRHIYSNRLGLGMVRTEENVLWSFAPHDISMILGLAGAAPERASTAATNILNASVADNATVQMEFASGLKASVSVSWLHPEKEQKLVIVGDKGMAMFLDTAPWEEKLVIYENEVQWTGARPKAVAGPKRQVEVAKGEPLKNEMAHFIVCVETRARPRTDAAEALNVLGVLQAAQLSMDRAGQWVELSDLTADASGKATDWAGRGVYVDPTARVDPGVEIGAGSKIWHFSHVLGGTTLGKRCIAAQNVMIGPDVVVGNGCKIQNNVSIYKGITLEDDVFCGPSMVFTNVLTPRAHVERKNEFAPTRIGKGATLGANCTIICGHDVGKYAMVGAGAVVTKDVPDNALVVGNPARRIGWVSRSGERLGDDLVCPRTNERYREVDGRLELDD